MDTNDKILSFDIVDIESLDLDLNDGFIDDGVHVVGGNEILADDALDVSDDFVMDIDSDQVFDYDLADFNEDGIINVDEMYNIQESDDEIDDSELSLDTDFVDEDNVYVVGLEDYSEDSFNTEDVHDNISEEELSLNSEELLSQEDIEIDISSDDTIMDI